MQLTVKELSGLQSCTEQNIRLQIKQGDITAELGKGSNGRAMYLIPLSSLERPLQVKWYRQQSIPLPANLKSKKRAPSVKQPQVSLESYTRSQREQIDFWINIINEWDKFRASSQSARADADTDFVEECKLRYPDKSLSVPTLYRRKAAYLKGNMDGLIEKRGLWRKGVSTIPESVWKVFLGYYLDQSEHSVAMCRDYTQKYFKYHRPDAAAEIPSIDTFYWRVNKEIPAPVDAYYRKGPKALHDRYAPYIRRIYDNMFSNDYWVADNHTFDFFSLDKDGKQHRLYLTAYLDARSTAIVGWQVTNSPCGDATLSALKKGIQANGIPDNIYVDNGTEFLVHDIGGRGHRKRKKDEDKITPPGVFARLGINMVNAIPGNPEAKIIERIFRDVKDFLSKTITTYCGGSITARPERLNKILKTNYIPTDEELITVIDEFVEGYYNYLPYNGSVKADHGKTKLEVYYEHRVKKRIPKTPEDLNLMMMRSSRPVTVGRRGVKLKVAGCNIDYFNETLLTEWQNKKVYYRYDPDNLTSVRIYNADEQYMDKYICTVPADKVAMMEYGADKETIKAGMQVINRYNNAIKKWTDGKLLDNDEKISVYSLMRIHSQENINNPPAYNTTPKIIDLVRAVEDTYEYPIAVGDQSTMLSNMIQSVKQRQNKEDFNNE